MTNPALRLLLSALLFCLASCEDTSSDTENGDNESSSSDSTDNASRTVPKLEIVSQDEFSLGNIKVHRWNLKTHRIKTIKMRMVQIADGKITDIANSEQTWDDWPDESGTGELLYLVQTGKPFGAEGKQLPMATLSFSDPKPQSGSSMNLNQLLTEGLTAPLSTKTSQGGIASGREELVFTQVFRPADNTTESYSYSNNFESLTKLTEEHDVTVLAIMLQWEPQTEED